MDPSRFVVLACCLLLNLASNLNADLVASNDCEWHWSLNDSIKFVGRRRCYNDRFCCGTCSRRYCCNDPAKRLDDQANCSDLFCGGFFYYKASGEPSKHALFKCNSSTEYICSGTCQVPECVSTSMSDQIRLDVDSCINNREPGSYGSSANLTESQWFWLVILVLMAVFVALGVTLVKHVQKNNNYCRPMTRDQDRQQQADLLSSANQILSVSSHSLPEFMAHTSKYYEDEPPSYESLLSSIRTTMRNFRESVRSSRESLSSRSENKT